jgi:two-component system sensor histidine kinase YesM
MNIFKTSIKARLILIFICCAIIPIVVQGIAVNRMYAGKLETKLNEASIFGLEKLAGEMTLNLQKQLDMSTIYTSNDQLKSIIRDASHNASAADRTLLMNTLFVNLVSSDLKMNALIVTPGGAVFTDREITPEAEKYISASVLGSDWYENSFKNQNGSMWIGMRGNYIPWGANSAFYLARHLLLNGENIGTVLVSVDDYLYYRLFDKVKMNASSSIGMLDQYGGVMLDSGGGGYANLLADPQVRAFAEKGGQSGSGYKLIAIKGLKYLVSYCGMPSPAWALVSITPESSVLGELQSIQMIPILLLLLMIVFLMLFAFILNREIFTPIVDLSKHLKKVQEGNLDASISLPYGNEIGELGKGFNKMTAELKRFVGRIKADEEQKRRLEVKALEAQIRPHFIYNTLNSIKWMAEMQNAPGITGAIVSLAQLIEYNTGAGGILAKVSEELEALRNYIRLQQLRYWNMLEAEFDIAEETTGLYIPRLSLQPVVENAIGHGLSGVTRRWELRIRARICPEGLLIEVEDNGAGIEREKLERLLTDHQSAGHMHLGGMGIYNVHQRIRLRYGEPYGIAVSSEVGRGTEVRLLFPLMDNPGEEAETDENPGGG